MRLKMISFRAEPDVLKALAELEAALGSAHVPRRRRSVVLRQAILDAHARLKKAPEGV